MAVCKDHPFDSKHGAKAYDCICDVGAEGQSTISKPATCTDVDGCDRTDCGANAGCTDVAFPGTGHTCQCDAGYYNAVYGLTGAPLNNDAHTNTAVDCKETTAQAGCAAGASVDGKFCDDTTLEFKPCNHAKPGYYLEGCRAVSCPVIPDTMVEGSVECSTGGDLIEPFGLCKQPYYPDPFDGRDQKTDTCTPCASQVGCAEDSGHCSDSQPKFLGCAVPKPNYIITMTDIVAPSTGRRLRGE
jgi:hypothetical protein